MLERKTNENKQESKMIEEERQKWFLKNLPETETEIDKIEQNVADNVLNNIKVDYDWLSWW